MNSHDKSPDAFRTISEVADDLDLPQHVLRFWETRFSQIKPLKRGGGRRYYRPDDVELLKGIRHLLYGEGYTIKGVQRILKEQGQRFVMQIWRADASPLQVVTKPQIEESQRVVDAHESMGVEAEALPNGVLPETGHEAVPQSSAGGLNILNRLRGEKPTPSASAEQSSVTREDIRRLQATLFELLECKRTLDQAR
ncbi:DNA-binding transcriptional MerR regulator [Labrenzia sp. EL_208]|uniref:MerR family transcriptional regulator n=1 Tax=Roseibium album TaxID=311410 RepID=UPI0018CBADB9|nr:DNA-binding transcriptional MerR regulator [Labrenzia sp. EL_162]MBG6176080.1 DNA-binding transcriptional MerR regulator [Labrenzia sp. EL_132]MBG6194022.1 DNA-binding transcriptional MerR regulator [Labrenzia sp. EL_159]MBG6230695.1 DNA-binding transcriptional MerR regulator [Labrenzia sp. EL_208]